MAHLRPTARSIGRFVLSTTRVHIPQPSRVSAPSYHHRHLNNNKSTHLVIFTRFRSSTSEPTNPFVRPSENSQRKDPTGGRRDPEGVSPQNLPSRTPAANSPGTTDQVYSDGTASEPNEPLTSGIEPSTIYTFEDIQELSSSSSSSSSSDPATSTSSPRRILIDVREPSEVLGTGRIPGAVNIPISSAPDSFFLSGEDFEDRYGWARPGRDTEVVFYCKAGVRSKAAARLAQQAGFGGKTGEFPGSWVEWAERGGQIDRSER